MRFFQFFILLEFSIFVFSSVNKHSHPDNHPQQPIFDLNGNLVETKLSLVPEGLTLQCSICETDVARSDLYRKTTGRGYHSLCVQARFASGNPNFCSECQKTNYAIFLAHVIFKAPEMPDGITYIHGRLDDNYLRKFWGKAASEPNSEALKRLIKIGMPTEGMSYNGGIIELIALAAQIGTIENMSFLLDSSGLKLCSKEHETLSRGFFFAVTSSNYENAALFLQRGVNINEIYEWMDHRNGLAIAIIKENIGSVKFFIDNNADLNLASPEDGSPLHLAVHKDNAEIVELLMKTGRIKIRATNRNKRNPIQSAACLGKLKALRALFDNGAPSEMFTAEGYSLLQYAIAAGPISSIQFLMNRGNMPITRFGAIYYALHLAICFGRTEVVKYLVKIGANPDERMIPVVLELCRTTFPTYSQRFALSDPPIVIAILKNDFEAFKALLEAGTDVNSRIFNSTCSLLHLVCEIGNVQMASHLISLGADTLSVDSKNRTPFYYNTQNFSDSVS